jgi:transcriptional regulator with XRE-family HTH domain
MRSVNPNQVQKSGEDYPNPVAVIREYKGLTQEQAAEELGMTRVAFIRYEQGLHGTLSPKVLRWVVEHGVDVGDGISVAPYVDFMDVGKRYRQFQTSKRQANFGVLSPDPLMYLKPYYQEPLAINLKEMSHPFEIWRSASFKRDSRINPSVTEVCVALCISHPVVHRFITQPSLVAQPPLQMLDALRESGYSRDVTQAFVQSYENWRNAKCGIRRKSRRAL